MTNVTSSVTLAVDSTQVKTADKALQDFAASGKKAESAAEGLQQTTKGAAEGFQAVATGVAGADAAVKRVGNSGQAAADGLKKTGEQAKLTGYQTAQLSAQLQDLFVQIQAGGSPVTALIQQGSQLSAVFGGFRGALAAVAGIFTPVVVGVGTLAASLAAVGYGFIGGRQQSVEFARALALTGNAAGKTEGQFNSLAAAVAKSTNTTVGGTRDVLQGLVASGRFSGDALNEAAKATQLLAKVTGASTADIVADFTKAADAPSRYAETINRQYNLLTASQLETIKAAEDQGRTQDALQIVLKALNERLTDASKNVGVLESAYSGLARAASGAKDALLGIGRQVTVDDEIARISVELANAQRQLDQFRKPGGGFLDIFLGNNAQTRVNELSAVLAKLKESKQLSEDVAGAQAADAKRVQAQISFAKALDDVLPRQQKLNRALENANALADAAGASAIDRATLLKAIIKQYEDGNRAALLASDTSAVEIALQKQTSAYKNAESVLDALRQAGKVADADFYASKLKFIDLNAAAQIRALEQEAAILNRQTLFDAEEIARDTKVKELTAEIVRIRAEAASKGLVLSIQEAGAAEAIAKAYTEAQIAAQQYLDTLQRGQQQELAGAGLGQTERQRRAARQQIQERYEQQRQQIDQQRRAGKITEEELLRQYALINDFQAKALSSYDAYFERRQQQENDFALGAQEALANYIDSSQQAAKLTETAFSNAFKGAEDALVQFVSTGKADFKSLVQSVLADLARIQIRQALAGLLSSFSGGVGFSTNSTGTSLPTAGGRAIGGPVSAGSAYRVLEKGQPELLTTGGKSYLMTGNQPGEVQPIQPAEPSITINVNAAGDISPNTARYITQQIKQALMTERRARAHAGA